MTFAPYRVAPTPSPVNPAACATLPPCAVSKKEKNRPQVSIAPPHLWEKPRSASCGIGVGEVGGELEEGLLALVEPRLHPAAVVVDRVVAAVEDAGRPVRVGREPRVVEAVVEVGDALPALPAQALELFGGERVRHERVVVDRHRVLPGTRDEGLEDVGAEGDVLRDDRAVRRREGDRRRVRPDRADVRVLVDLHTQVEADASQLPRQLRRVDERRTGRLEQAGLEDRRVDLRLHRLAVEEPGAVLLGALPQPVDVVWGRRRLQQARLLPVAVHVVPGDGLADLA